MVNTQLENARNNIITKEMKIVAKNENIPVKKLIKALAGGQVVIPANLNHKKLKPIGIGRGLKTKINANIGASPKITSQTLQLKNLRICEKYKADTVMDLSIGDFNLDKVRRQLLQTYLPFGTVPIYQAIIESGGINKLTIEKYLEVIDRQGKDGVDFITVHAGFLKQFIPHTEKRLTGVVSRGGAMLLKWMKHTGHENFLYIHFNKILEIARKYDITLSLGDGLRPGSIADNTDKAQIGELKVLGMLTKRCWEKGVQVMIEGPGHIPLNQIEKNIKLQKKYCYSAPFYVLGPLPTDIGAGYDHIGCAIGGALAGMYGADFLCYVTPSEHICLPNSDDVRQGIIITRLAAHIADIAKGIPRAIEKDKKMSHARKNFDWKKMENLSINPERFRAYRSRCKNMKTCSMCGEYCSMLN